MLDPRDRDLLASCLAELARAADPSAAMDRILLRQRICARLLEDDCEADLANGELAGLCSGKGGRG